MRWRMHSIGPRTFVLCKAISIDLVFPDAAFGLVTALDVVDQREVDPAAALAEIHRVLMPPAGCLYV